MSFLYNIFRSQKNFNFDTESNKQLLQDLISSSESPATIFLKTNGAQLIIDSTHESHPKPTDQKIYDGDNISIYSPSELADSLKELILRYFPPTYQDSDLKGLMEEPIMVLDFPCQTDWLEIDTLLSSSEEENYRRLQLALSPSHKDVLILKGRFSGRSTDNLASILRNVEDHLLKNLPIKTDNPDNIREKCNHSITYNDGREVQVFFKNEILTQVVVYDSQKQLIQEINYEVDSLKELTAIVGKEHNPGKGAKNLFLKKAIEIMTTLSEKTDAEEIKDILKKEITILNKKRA